MTPWIDRTVFIGLGMMLFIALPVTLVAGILTLLGVHVAVWVFVLVMCAFMLGAMICFTALFVGAWRVFGKPL